MYKAIDGYIDSLLQKSTPEKPIWNIEAIRQGKKPGWNYIDGCMLIALYNLFNRTKDKKYFDFIKSYIDFFITEDGSVKTFKLEDYNLDNINEGRVLIDLYLDTKNEKYKLAAKTVHAQLESQPRSPLNSFWHKKIYPNQVWLDGLFMAQVFSLRYNKVFGNGDLSDIYNQFRNVEKYMKDEKSGLYYHGFDVTKQAFWANEKGLSANFWLRSMGWYIAALADVTSYLDDNIVKSEFAAYLKNALDSVYNYMDKDACMFYQVVDKHKEKGNYLETSGSALIAYASLKAYNSGILGESYAKTGKAIFDGICKKYLTQTPQGLELGGICLVAGLGPENKRNRDGSVEYYLSEPIVSTDAKGVAPFIMTFVELKTFSGF